MIEWQHQDVLQVMATQVRVDCSQSFIEVYRCNGKLVSLTHSLTQTQRACKFTNFQEMTKGFQKTLRHDDFIYTTDLCTTVSWMETMIASLTHLENSKYR